MARNNSVNFTGGGGINIANTAGITASGGCTGSLCNNVQTFMPPTVNPYAVLDTAMAAMTALPNGAARPSIPKPACSTSTRTRWPGFCGWLKGRSRNRRN